MSNEDIPISVIMPVFNAEQFVGSTIESILAQTLKEFEFIAIDDGSSDNSLSILREYEQRDSRLRIVSRPNAGLVATLNEGLGLARGEFIARIDADDLAHPNRFNLQLARMRGDHDLVALGSCAAVIDESGRSLGDFPVPITHEEIEAEHLKGRSAIHHPAVMLRAEAVRKVGGYRNLVPCEDFDLWLRLGEQGRLANLPDILLTKRLSDKSTLASHMERAREVISQILIETWERRGLSGTPNLPPISDVSRETLYRQWGWMALNNKHIWTSRHWALKAILANPCSRASWLLLACSIRGR